MHWSSLLSNCSAHVTEMLLCCSAFASLDQKSLVMSSHFHSSISSITSAKNSHNHSSKVRFNPASMVFLRHVLMSHASLGMQQQLLWTIPLLALVWEDGIWSGHVLQWSFAWPLPWCSHIAVSRAPISQIRHASSRFITWRVRTSSHLRTRARQRQARTLRWH